MSRIILPGDPEFDETLGWFPPNFQQVADQTGGDFALIVRAEGSGLLEAVPWSEVVEYMHGGELELREQEMEDDLADDWNSNTGLCLAAY